MHFVNIRWFSVANSFAFDELFRNAHFDLPVTKRPRNYFFRKKTFI